MPRAKIEVKPLWNKVKTLDGTGKIKPIKWLIKGLIPEASVGFFAGQSGAYKTFGMLGLAGSLIDGGEWHGYSVKRRGGVVYIAYEGEYTIEERVAAVAKITGKLEPPIVVPEEPGQLDTDSSIESLESSLQEESEIMQERYGVPLVCVMIDTVAASGLIPPDKENDPGAWSWVFFQLGRIARRLNIAIILCHHAGKDASAGLRGSSAAKGGADFILTMSAERDEITGESNNRFLHVSKTRRGGEGTIGAVKGKSVVVGVDEDGEDIEALVLTVDRDAKYVSPDAKQPKGKRGAKVNYDAMSGDGSDRQSKDDEAGGTGVALASAKHVFEAVYGLAANRQQELGGKPMKLYDVTFTKDQIRKQYDLIRSEIAENGGELSAIESDAGQSDGTIRKRFNRGLELAIEDKLISFVSLSQGGYRLLKSLKDFGF